MHHEVWERKATPAAFLGRSVLSGRDGGGSAGISGGGFVMLCDLSKVARVSASWPTVLGSSGERQAIGGLGCCKKGVGGARGGEGIRYSRFESGRDLVVDDPPRNIKEKSVVVYDNSPAQETSVEPRSFRPKSTDFSGLSAGSAFRSPCPGSSAAVGGLDGTVLRRR
ncbi:hypothetical protein H4582DRAFT_2129939 [Lactarius indigo]|nr:hypothetical protein H4582DRAFT_2129939 [Lactarius indigo]